MRVLKLVQERRKSKNIPRNTLVMHSLSMIRRRYGSYSRVRIQYVQYEGSAACVVCESTGHISDKQRAREQSFLSVPRFKEGCVLWFTPSCLV